MKVNIYKELDKGIRIIVHRPENEASQRLSVDSAYAVYPGETFGRFTYEDLEEMGEGEFNITP